MIRNAFITHMNNARDHCGVLRIGFQLVHDWIIKSVSNCIHHELSQDELSSSQSIHMHLDLSIVAGVFHFIDSNWLGIKTGNSRLGLIGGFLDTFIAWRGKLWLLK